MVDTHSDASLDSGHAGIQNEQVGVDVVHEAPQNMDSGVEADAGYASGESDSPADTQAFILERLDELARQNADLLRERASYTSPVQNVQQGEEPLTARDIIRRELTAISQEKQQLEYDRVQQDYTSKLARAPHRFKDFGQTVIQNGEVPFTDAMIEIIKGSDDPVATIYHAAKHHAADLQKIRAMPNYAAQMREMVKLEEKIKTSLRPRNISKTPAPMNEDIGSAGASSGYDLNSADGMMAYLNKIGKG
jgi:hypothetical protein